MAAAALLALLLVPAGFAGGERALRTRSAARLTSMTAVELTLEKVRDVTLMWVERAVVGLQLCPFAEAPLRSGGIGVHMSTATDQEELLADIDEQCARLLGQSKEQVATVLIAAPNLSLPFLEFQDGVATLEDEELFGETFPAYDERVMLVCFHPEAMWEGLSADDPLNYEKRAPWVVVNLLRTEMVDAAILTGRTVDIGAKNEIRLREAGIDRVRAIYRDIFSAFRLVSEVAEGHS
ncbi:hypothetical protein T492DRAFT_1073206 [Pavlovales sp. CCMP2436]|nr:hypothetical protein T492DRAFT_1073206 [Pavlovales sp. CCMP2436]|mmetsp:Transcript_5032/g.13042  ORF Transcript_5032/g.13042 Transcript_5032/m.13042 type:complete len:237 (+) Transcript_5032:59-769(+)